MKKKRRIAFSDAASADILEQSDWYLAQSGRTLSRRWQKAVTSAVSHIVRYPASGALCTFQSPELWNVRRVSIQGFAKHLLFYRFDGDEVFVLRIVHGARDLERLFS